MALTLGYIVQLRASGGPSKSVAIFSSKQEG
jgi:hypothetical protein